MVIIIGIFWRMSPNYDDEASYDYISIDSLSYPSEWS